MQAGDKIEQVEILEIRKYGKVLVRCSCGVEKVVNKRSLKNGDVKSCGHLHSESARISIAKARAVRMAAIEARKNKDAI